MATSAHSAALAFEANLNFFDTSLARSGHGLEAPAVETLEHLESPAAIVGEFKAVSNVDSIIYVTVPNDGFYSGKAKRSINKYHRHVFDFIAAKSLCEDILGAGNWAMCQARLDN